MSLDHCPVGLACLIAAIVAGCAMLTGSPGKHEPAVIALRNTTGQQLASVAIQEDLDPQAGPVRLGQTAPVLENFTYTFVRPANPLPLPSRLQVVWRYSSQAEQSKVVSIGDVLRKASGAPDEAIVFEIQSGGQVEVYLDRVAP